MSRRHHPLPRQLGARPRGASFPLLADLEPKGEVARAYGLYLDGPGISDRATVWIDASGVVRHASSAGPGGERDVGELAALAVRLDAEYDGPSQAFAPAPGASGAKLYVKDACGFSRAVRVAVDNLHLQGLETCNVSQDAQALAELKERTGAETAPVLVLGDEALPESAAIISRLADQVRPVE